MLRIPHIKPSFVVWFLWLAMAVVGGCARGDKADDADEYRASVDAWHRERVARLRGETGWLTLVGLHPLPPGRHTLGTAPANDIVLRAEGPARVGTLSMAAGRAHFAAAPGVVVSRSRADSLLDPSFEEGVVLDDTGEGPDLLSTGSLVFYVVKRGDEFFLRVKDRNSAVRRHFQGIDRYPVDPVWRVTGRLVGEATEIEVLNVLGQTARELSPGRLEFTLQGKVLHLQATQASGGRLFVVFGDETNGETTYPGGRFLVVDPPTQDGQLVLDFNRATNPPCSFTPYATCPLPGPDNVLPVAVRAGEKRWGAGH